ncbi:aldehyde dehydrogenase family protein, partial [Rhizobium leguminosarum]|nr:aldehyde dehydrogenase family protein [Rhizobium ruizarguesonis]
MPAMKQQAHSVLDALGVHLPASGDLSVRSPIDGSVLAQLPTASAADMQAAIGRAHEAFKAWRVVPAPKRGELVRLFGEELRAHKAQLAQLVSIEAGK